MMLSIIYKYQMHREIATKRTKTNNNNNNNNNNSDVN